MADTLGKYQILEKIGSGTYADVYKALDTVLKRTVALKVLKSAWLADVDTFTRFVQEAQTAAGLFHPHIATVLDLGQAEGRNFIAMRYVDGPSLAQLLKERGSLPWAEALKITEEVAAALEFAHARGLVHRDVKPQNILVSPTEGAVLTDFGLVKAMQASGMGISLGSGAVIGTPQYIPPEVWDDQPAGPAADQYALACVLVEMLTGRVLFGASSTPAVMKKHMNDGPKLPVSWPEGVPVRVSTVLRKALKAEPGDRYASMGKFVEALKKTELRPAIARQQDIPPTDTASRVPERATYDELLSAWRKNEEARAKIDSMMARKGESQGEKIGEREQPYLEEMGGERHQPAFSEKWDGAGTRPGIQGVRPGLDATKGGSKTPEPAKQDNFCCLILLILSMIIIVAVIVGLNTSLKAKPPITRITATATPRRTPTVQLSRTSTSRPTRTRTPTPTSDLPDQITDPKGVKMALIPAGSFQMGSNQGESNEKPVHKVTLDAFYMDVYEVTNTRYKACVGANVCLPPYKSSSTWRSSYYGNSKYGNYPVVWVSWEDARAYCEWRGARLPTEAEWEKAARGGLSAQIYPWGNNIYCNQANFRDCMSDTGEVGNYPPNRYGLFDMVGNVWEWVNDWYSATYYNSSPTNHPTGPTSGEDRVLRGGSWYSYPESVRVANRSRSEPDSHSNELGFRCARSP